MKRPFHFFAAHLKVFSVPLDNNPSSKLFVALPVLTTRPTINIHVVPSLRVNNKVLYFEFQIPPFFGTPKGSFYQYLTIDFCGLPVAEKGIKMLQFGILEDEAVQNIPKYELDNIIDIDDPCLKADFVDFDVPFKMYPNTEKQYYGQKELDKLMSSGGSDSCTIPPKG